jgi:cytochrome c oxidase assembly protein subunit 15
VAVRLLCHGFLTMVVGGVTRLTHSGLSIVEWKPLIGALPPLSARRLAGTFRQVPADAGIPSSVNHDMTLDGFQFIFWWEWAHRLSGRFIGVVFLLPYLYFLFRGYLKGALAGKVFGFFILGGLQGAMGWYMVKSGLVDDPRVSQYRLAAHLGLAFMLFGLMFWTGLGMLQPRSATAGSPRRLTQSPWQLAGGAGLRHGAVGCAGRRHPRRPRLQHLPADERALPLHRRAW